MLNDKPGLEHRKSLDSFSEINRRVAQINRRPFYTYPKLGPKRLVADIATSVDIVTRNYPMACGALVERSDGLHRSYWVDGHLIAHAWQVKPTTKVWLRILGRP